MSWFGHNSQKGFFFLLIKYENNSEEDKLNIPICFLQSFLKLSFEKYYFIFQDVFLSLFHVNQLLKPLEIWNWNNYNPGHIWPMGNPGPTDSKPSRSAVNFPHNTRIILTNDKETPDNNSSIIYEIQLSEVFSNSKTFSFNHLFILKIFMKTFFLRSIEVEQ